MNYPFRDEDTREHACMGEPDCHAHLSGSTRTSSLPVEEMKQVILNGVAVWREGPPTDDVSLMLVHVR